MKSNFNSTLKSSDFGDDFIWGTSTAAFQIEGNPYADGKKASIWDEFSHKKGKIYKGQNADIACDFYNRYREDLLLLKAMNIKHFRFSLSWSRILPDGTGKINEAGLDFYDRLIDECLALGITPWVTLYHWDLPQALENKGGWTNREIINWFTEYVTICVHRFGDRVKNWMVLNEPLVFLGAGHFLGIHAPGRRGVKNFIPAMHHASLCQAEGGRILRAYDSSLNIGTTFSCSYIEAYRDRVKDHHAANRVDCLVNRLFLELSLGYGYPFEELPFLKRVDKFYKAEDNKLLQFEFDFIGIQNYTREIVKSAWWIPYVQATNIKAETRNIPTTEMGWEIYPEGILELLKKYDAYPEVKNILVTENGAAFPDHLVNNQVKDPKRQKYLQEYINAVLKAKQQGVNVNGYFVWSFTDNFEWAEGYKPRFGMVYIDYPTQQRIVKNSGMWYRDFIKTQSQKIGTPEFCTKISR
ncbi:GH1 family beta-glucosidase [Zunongwangia endophytica]|uniref:Beta-glucosidase n=1 Tax=Zunongwangia endophytica TaxID=1808945 RepID=A0ABV8HFB6_9FLAO|nr:GH1 family beta-glucosidase [Zunongwangia endophytica]MDN3594057.1 GH1 family beta-glucosidase [Zunongwangia endophytica]